MVNACTILAQSYNVDGCVWSIHLATHPQFPKGHLFLLFWVCSLENKIDEEEATISQPGSTRLGYANKKCKQQEDVLWHSRESWVVVTSLWKRLQVQRGSLLCLAKTRTQTKMSHRSFLFLFLIKSFYYLSLDAFLNWYFIILIYKFFPISTKGNLIPYKQGYTYIKMFKGPQREENK